MITRQQFLQFQKEVSIPINYIKLHSDIIDLIHIMNNLQENPIADLNLTTMYKNNYGYFHEWRNYPHTGHEYKYNRPMNARECWKIYRVLNEIDWCKPFLPILYESLFASMNAETIPQKYRNYLRTSDHEHYVAHGDHIHYFNGDHQHNVYQFEIIAALLSWHCEDSYTKYFQDMIHSAFCDGVDPWIKFARSNHFQLPWKPEQRLHLKRFGETVTKELIKLNIMHPVIASLVSKNYINEGDMVLW